MFNYDICFPKLISLHVMFSDKAFYGGVFFFCGERVESLT